MAAVIMTALVLAGPAFGSGHVREDTLRALLPGDQAVPGWGRDGEPREFAGEDLFSYIDGGAEIYQEYGFRRVVVQDYKGTGGKSVSLEIFEMASPEAAFGMFTFKRSGKGRAVALGSAGELADYYLNFWKGRFLATLTGFGSDPATLAGLQAVAAAVDAGITDAGPTPALVAALPGQGLIPGSVKYLRGLLGLNNVYPLYTARGLHFQAAVKGDYEDGLALIILDYGSAEARAESWNELQGDLETAGKFKRTADVARASVFQDPKGGFAAFAGSGPRLLVGIGASAAAALGRLR